MFVFTAESRASVDSESEKPVKMSENKIAEPVTVSGVNRRTMILFSKKAKQRRLSAIQLMAAKDFEKKEAVKIGTGRTDVSELSRCSSANGFAVKLPLQAESSTVDNATFSVARRPPAKRQHASASGHTGSVICNGSVGAENRVVAEFASRSKPGINEEVRKKTNPHKIRVLDTAGMLNGVSDSSDLSDSGSSRYPIRGNLLFFQRKQGSMILPALVCVSVCVSVTTITERLWTDFYPILWEGS